MAMRWPDRGGGKRLEEESGLSFLVIGFKLQKNSTPTSLNHWRLY
jgi:hypothetical protein